MLIRMLFQILVIARIGFAFRPQHRPSFHSHYDLFMAQSEDQSINTLRGFGRASLQRYLTIFTALTVSQLITKKRPVEAFGGVDKAGLFDLCPDDAFLSSCVSSQDDRPSFFLPPWTYDGNMKDIKQRLLEVILKLGGTVLTQQEIVSNDRYLSVEFKNEDGKIDECEFYFTPNDTTIQFRCIRKGNIFDYGANRNRIELIQRELKVESVTVLRNRRRVLFFVESPLDAFGPPTAAYDKLIDQISGDAENSSGVLGVLDPLLPVWEARSKNKQNSKY